MGLHINIDLIYLTLKFFSLSLLPFDYSIFNTTSESDFYPGGLEESLYID